MNIDMLEQKLYECGGQFAVNHSRRLLKIIDVIGAGLSYDRDIVEFCAYVHDLGAYIPYKETGKDHAVRSDEIVSEIIDKFCFDKEQITTVSEVVRNHHGDLPGKSMESILFRDADIIDFLGIFGIARNFSRFPLAMDAAFNTVMKQRNKLPDMLVLEASRRLAKDRIMEMDKFIEAFKSESMGDF